MVGWAELNVGRAKAIGREHKTIASVEYATKVLAWDYGDWTSQYPASDMDQVLREHRSPPLPAIPALELSLKLVHNWTIAAIGHIQCNKVSRCSLTLILNRIWVEI